MPKVSVVTGANSGIGRSMVEQLARLGHQVVMVCRNEERGRAALVELRSATGRDDIELFIADLSRMAEVRRVAEELRRRHPAVHVLANNAGVYLPTRKVTADGLEEMFATNHLAPFLLTHELLGALSAGAPSRVVTTSSAGHQLGHLDFDDLQAERGFGGLRQYSNTKLANILFTRELAARVRGRGVVAHAFHPGMVATGFAQDEPGWFGTVVRLSRPFLRSAERAAETGVYLCTSEEAGTTTGEYWASCKRKKPSREARDDRVAKRLWEESERLLSSLGSSAERWS